MAAFDPSTYADQVDATAKGGFDPTTYADAVEASQQPSATLSAGATAAFHAARHLASGLGDKIIAAEQALSEKLSDKTGQTSFPDAYKRNLAFNDKLLENSDKEHPAGKWIGNGLGIFGSTAALAAVAPLRALLAARGLVPAAEAAAPAAGTLAGLIRGGKEGWKLGTTMGAVGGYGGDRSDSLGGTLASVGAGGFAGGTLGWLLGALGGGVSAKLAQRSQPQVANKFTQALGELQRSGDAPSLPMAASSVEPIPEAITLRKYGVPLTLRQMAPDGPLAEISEASERVPFLGKAVKAQEKVPQREWLNVAARQAMPGEGPMVNGDVADKLGDIQGQISALYKQVENVPAKIAATHPDTGKLVNPVEAFKAILDDPGYRANTEDTKAVSSVFRKELEPLYRTTEANRLGQEPSIKTGDLMDLRSALRSHAQSARQTGDAKQAEMFQDAADAMTGGIKASLSPQGMALLNRADAAYSNLSRLLGASKNTAGNMAEGEFTPQQLSREIAKAYGKKFFTDSEAGGTLRDLARAGKVVFTPRDPMTGHGERLKSVLGLTLGNFVRAANENPTAQAALTAAAQRAAQTNSSAMMPPAAGAFESALTRYLQGVPAGTLPAESLNALTLGALSGRGGSGQ